MERSEPPVSPRIIGSNDGHIVDLGTFATRFLIEAEETGGRFSLVEHPIPPRTLAAPLHKHLDEDEFSYVLEGRLGVILGDEIVYGNPGDLVIKPRNQWHTFWNASDKPCRILEIISPGGFERMFADMGADPETVTGDTASNLDAKYRMEVDYDSIDLLCDKLKLNFPED